MPWIGTGRAMFRNGDRLPCRALQKADGCVLWPVVRAVGPCEPNRHHFLRHLAGPQGADCRPVSPHTPDKPHVTSNWSLAAKCAKGFDEYVPLLRRNSFSQAKLRTNVREYSRNSSAHLVPKLQLGNERVGTGSTNVGCGATVTPVQESICEKSLALMRKAEFVALTNRHIVVLSYRYSICGSSLCLVSSTSQKRYPWHCIPWRCWPNAQRSGLQIGSWPKCSGLRPIIWQR